MKSEVADLLDYLSGNFCKKTGRWANQIRCSWSVATHLKAVTRGELFNVDAQNNLYIMDLRLVVDDTVAPGTIIVDRNEHVNMLGRLP